MWVPLQELSKARGHFQRMQLEPPEELHAAAAVCAQCSATMAEALLVAAITNPNMQASHKKDKILSCQKKLEGQTSHFGIDVKALVHPPLWKASNQWLLRH